MEIYARALLAVLVTILLKFHNVQCEWDTRPYFDIAEQVERRYSSELVTEFEAVQDDALLLYTEFSANSGANYKKFTDELNSLIYGNHTEIENAPESCKAEFQKQLKKIKLRASRSASYGADNHHRYFLGPMTVFRMHLNKSEAYLKKATRNLKRCGDKNCETIPSVLRWRKLAAAEINRVKSDMANIRPIYLDLLVHFKHRLNRIWKLTEDKLREAKNDLEQCRS